HLDERFLPSSPAPSQYDPEQLVCRSEWPARALGVKSQQLLTQGKIFEDDILAGPEGTNNPAEDVPEPYDHAQNLTGTLPIELAAKSLILRVYDVLMNDRALSDRNLFVAQRAGEGCQCHGDANGLKSTLRSRKIVTIVPVMTNVFNGPIT